MYYDKDFYQKVLRGYFGDGNLEVDSFHEEPATLKGENFLSDMLRIRLSYTRKSSFGDNVNCRVSETRSLILKHEPLGDPVALEFIQNQKLFTVELEILRDVLPRIENSLGIRLGPKFVYGCDESPRNIIMEDLAPEGFCVKDRQQGFSMAHSAMAIANLAKFHAGSVALYEENPEYLKSFKQGIFDSTTHPNIYVLAVNSLFRLSEDAVTWSDESCRLAAMKLRNAVTSIKDTVQNVYKYDADEFCVLNHGDAWINNMLFTEDESGKPLAQVFVDYQMSGFSSPAIDLLYFLSINLSPDVRGDGEDELLNIYLDTLRESMKKLQCKTKPPTMSNLKEAMYRRRVYSLVAGLFLLPRMMLDRIETESMEELLKNGKSKKNPYEKPNVIRTMKIMLPLLNKRGFLDP